MHTLSTEMLDWGGKHERSIPEKATRVAGHVNSLLRATTCFSGLKTGGLGTKKVLSCGISTRCF